MRNCKGPKESKRRLYTTVAMQVMLYAAPVWAHDRMPDTHRRALNGAQRVANIRQMQGYGNVGGATACVLTGNPPADLVAEEYARVQTRLDRGPLPKNAKRAIKEEEKHTTRRMWNDRWQEENNWTKKICSDVRSVNHTNKRNTFHTSQLLSGKGVFNAYRKVIRKTDSSKCWYCEEQNDTAEHTLFHCPRWKDEREALGRAVGELSARGNFLKDITDTRDTWMAFSRFAASVMKEKEEEERREESRRREEAREARRRRCSLM